MTSCIVCVTRCPGVELWLTLPAVLSFAVETLDVFVCEQPAPPEEGAPQPSVEIIAKTSLCLSALVAPTTQSLRVDAPTAHLELLALPTAVRTAVREAARRRLDVARKAAAEAAAEAEGNEEADEPSPPTAAELAAAEAELEAAALADEAMLLEQLRAAHAAAHSSDNQRTPRPSSGGGSDAGDGSDAPAAGSDTTEFHMNVHVELLVDEVEATANRRADESAAEQSSS